MTYDGRAIANFILDECEAHNQAITNLSLQKIAFFCHAWSLISLKKPLIRHKFEAWQYGPVLQYLYHEFKQFDRNPIKTRATKINPHTGTKQVVEYSFDDETAELLRQVVAFYSNMTAGDLVTISHVENGPWDIAWNHEGKINPGMLIDDAEITKFYSRVPALYLIQ